jgi:Tfp pilus assembly PilM family ATPase
LSPDLWVPGAAEPSLDDLVARIHRQIEHYTSTHTAELSHVEVELAGGERLTLRSISADPGFGFLTLAVHSEDGEAEELIIPVGAIRRIALGPADETRRPGFALPGRNKKGPGTAA